MGSDNGKAGEVDWYDVWSVADYIQSHYQGTVHINLSSTLGLSKSAMLLCASFVGDELVSTRGAAGYYEIPHEPRAMRKVPKLAYELLLSLQEEIDTLPPGTVIILPPGDERH